MTARDGWREPLDKVSNTASTSFSISDKPLLCLYLLISTVVRFPSHPSPGPPAASRPPGAPYQSRPGALGQLHSARYSSISSAHLFSPITARCSERVRSSTRSQPAMPTKRARTSSALLPA